MRKPFFSFPIFTWDLGMRHVLDCRKQGRTVLMFTSHTVEVWSSSPGIASESGNKLLTKHQPW